MNELTTQLESILQWSDYRTFTNDRGTARVRTAEPTPAFWNLWRAQKPELQALKVFPKLKDEKWIVNWYSDVPSSSSPTPSPAPSTPLHLPKQIEKRDRVWSDEQKAIFSWFESGTGSLVVRARAGTGKTTTIKTAFTYAKEERMLYAVFNKKNQIEATEAISDPRVEIKTLHSLGYLYIQQVWPYAKPDDSVEDDRIITITGEDIPAPVRTQIRKLVGFAKNTLVVPTASQLIDLAEERDIECPAFESFENGGWNREKLAEVALLVLEASKKYRKDHRISFNDMVWLPVANNWVRAWFDLVVIDEAQDMNLPQLLMAKGACKKGGRICVVGDDRQAIYGFRGAASNGMNMMKEELKAAELGLTTTYRCPKAVVTLAAALVPDYKAADAAPDGVVDHLDFPALENTLQVGDAVLSRANAPLMPVCLSLLRKGVSARIEGRDIGESLISIVESLKAKTVPVFLTRIERWGEKQIARFQNTKNFEAKSATIQDQVDTLIAIAEGASSVREITTRISNIFQDSGKGSKPAVILSTTHKAKGLEWEKVFLLSATFNRKRPVNAAPVSPEVEAARAQEEANIYYVALTRAKAHLVLVSGQPRRK